MSRANRIERAIRRCSGLLVVLGAVGGLWWMSLSGDLWVKLLVAVGHLLGVAGGVVLWRSGTTDLAVARRWLAVVAGGIAFPAAFGVWFYIQVVQQSGGFYLDLVARNVLLHIGMIGPAVSVVAAAGTRLFITHQAQLAIAEAPPTASPVEPESPTG